jgi:Flp pilus assembly protein TadG
MGAFMHLSGGRLVMAKPRRNHHRRGGVLIETAIVLPLLFVLAFGVVEFGSCIALQHQLKGAAHAGARAAIQQGIMSNAQVEGAVSNVMEAVGISSENYTVVTDPVDISAALQGDNITVSVECRWGTVGIRPMGFIDAEKNIRAFVVMQKE